MPRMHGSIRTPERYQFLKGVITNMSEDAVEIVPYGKTYKVVAKFVPGTTEFWNGGFDFALSGTPSVGQQGTATAFRDENGNLLVETLYVAREQIRGVIQSVESDQFLVRQKPINKGLSEIVLVTILPNCKQFDDTPADLRKLATGAWVTAIRKVLAHSHLEAFRIDHRR